MKKNYFSSLLFLFFALMASQISMAQLVANPDFGAVANGTDTTVVIQDVLANDTFNGLPVTLSQVTLEATSSTSNLTIDSNGSVIFSQGPAQQGTYFLSYLICLQTPPFSCAEGSVSVDIFCATSSAPVVDNVVQPTCANPNGSITMSGIPANGVLRYTINGGPMLTAVGTGTVTIGATAGVYTFHVFQDNCNSAPVTVPINSLNGVNYNMVGTYVDFNANGYTDVGDVINYQFTVTNNACADLNNITVTSTGLNYVGGPLIVLPYAVTDNTTFNTTYALTQNDINNGTVSHASFMTGIYTGGNAITVQDSATTILNISDGIRMIAFIDTNNNGIKDIGESNFTLGNFNYEINNDGVVHNVASNQPLYLFESNAANSYDLSYTVNSNYALYYTVSPSAFNNITVAANSGVTTYYFPVTSLPYNNLTVHLTNHNAPPRPGFIYQNTLIFKNNGNLPVVSGTVTFTKDDLLTITSISQAGTTPTATGFTYNFSNLLAGESRSMNIFMQVPTIPTVFLGNPVTNSASITAPVTDVNTADNNHTLTQIIVGSYDPNDKAESHGGQVLFSTFSANDYLTYTIQFENTGTANAVNVRVNDVLDSQLDETTVRMVIASHAYTLERVGSNLTWKFDGIELPPSEPNSTVGHGYITFQVKPKPGYAIGDAIPNTADIFFDFNPPIVTNTQVTEFVVMLSTEKFAFDNFKYFPNPVKNILTLSNDSAIDNVIVTSVIGQTIMEKSVNSLKSEIDLSALANGVYFVKATSQKQTKIIKIIKE